MSVPRTVYLVARTFLDEKQLGNVALVQKVYIGQR